MFTAAHHGQGRLGQLPRGYGFIIGHLGTEVKHGINRTGDFTGNRGRRINYYRELTNYYIGGEKAFSRLRFPVGFAL